MQPALSVIIPCHNAQQWIGETLTSVLAGTTLPLEVIVVDDGSTDQSASTVESMASVRLVRSENRGVSAARNLGFQASQAAGVVFLDADDLLLPGALDRQFKVWEQSGADMVYGDYQHLEEREGGRWEPAKIMATSFGDEPELAVIQGVWRPSGAYLFRRTLVAEIGGFEPTQSVLADCRFYFDCAVKARGLAHNPSVTCLYRVHRNGQSMATRNQRLFFDENLRNLERARHTWESRNAFDGPRKDAYLRVLDFIARGTARAHPDLFAATCAHFEQVTGGVMPFGKTVTRMAVRCLGYGRYRWIQSLLRR
jgi:glycosyltransferase involved in cell wall biosynthesis